MKTTHSLTICLAALWFGETGASAAAFIPGEILLSNYFGSNVQRYSAAGVLEQTYTGIETNWQVASLTPDGNLVTSHASPSPGINIFNPAGTQIDSFAVPGGLPGDVSVFANGTLAVSDQPGNVVHLFSQSGTLLSTVSLPGLVHPLGNTIGTDNILYVAGANTNNLAKVSQAGAFLGTISLGFKPSDLVMSPTDGTLWISGLSSGLVEHITTSGTVLGSFSTGLSGQFDGIGIAPDGNSLYVTTESASVIRHFDLSGNQLGEFSIVSPNIPAYLNVVPNPVPEPSILAMLGLCIPAWYSATRMRRREV